MKTKFENIKGMLRREEMKQVVGGDVYNGQNNAGGSAATPAPGTAMGGALNSTNGLSINYGNGGNYSTSDNYGAGMNGSAASGNNSTNGTGGSSTTGANTFTNMGYAKP